MVQDIAIFIMADQ